MIALALATPEYGAKAYNLARLIGHTAVPQGFALHPDDKRSSGNTRRIMNRFRGQLVAVRSSALGEDGKAVSFAGQHDTFLNVMCEPNSLWEAINKVKDSVNKSQDYQDVSDVKVTRMGVIVQEMLAPQLSGVMFTSDPTSAAYGTMLIEYVEGLGDKLVGGEVNPDGRVRVTGDEFDVEIAHPLPWSAKRLVELGQRLVDRFNEGPLDIEWAMSPMGHFYILQARPITGVNWNVEGRGTSVQKGVVEGTGRWVHGAHDNKKVDDIFYKGDILLTGMTDPRMIHQMILSAGMVTEIGGQTCHAAIVARELGKPCIIGAGNIVRAFIGLDTVIDADKGEVYARGD